MLAWCEPGAGASGLICSGHVPASQEESASLETQASCILKPKKKERETKPKEPNHTQSSHPLAHQPGLGREEAGETQICSPPKTRTPSPLSPPTRSTRALIPLKMPACALGALRGGSGSQTPEKFVAGNMLVTKSSQLPHTSPAKACGLQVSEKLPGSWPQHF